MFVRDKLLKLSKLGNLLEFAEHIDKEQVIILIVVPR